MVVFEKPKALADDKTEVYSPGCVYSLPANEQEYPVQIVSYTVLCANGSTSRLNTTTLSQPVITATNESYSIPD